MKQSSLKIYESRLEIALEYINEHLDQKILLTDLAKETFFSPYHFHRIFSAVQKESVSEYINRIKLERSTEQLAYTKKQISEIAYALGYSSSSVFSRAFKNYFECSPLNYRNSGLSKNSKICKKRHDISEYLCRADKIEPKIELGKLDFKTIAYYPVQNSFKEGVALNALSELIKWSKKMNLYNEGKLMGYSPDDIMVTPKAKYRYFVGISIPSSFSFEHKKIKRRTVSTCEYAFASVKGTIEDVIATWDYIYNKWLPNSHYEPENSFNIEFFDNKDKATNWSSFELKLAVPIKKLTIK